MSPPDNNTDDDTDSDTGFLGRWARRKAGAAAETAPAETPQPAPPASAPPTSAPEESDAAALERLGLPAPETLQAGDDFAAFLRAPLPQALRRRALRRLWAVNPALANLDGLLEYGEDFTLREDAIATVKTAWQLGRGYLEAPAGAGATGGPDPETETAAPPAESGAGRPAPEGAFDPAPPDGPAADGEEEAAEISPLLAAPRMRFQFDD